MSDEQNPQGPSGSGPTYHQEVQHAPVTARVPDRVGMGVFSTGTIVMHGPHDFVIDFLQSLAAPKRIAARVVLPPSVVPLFLAAMQDNFAKYAQTFGPVPRMPPMHAPSAGPVVAPGERGAPPAAPAPGERGRPAREAPEDSGSEVEEDEEPWNSEASNDEDGPGEERGGAEAEESEDTPPFPLSHPAPGATGGRGPHVGQEPPPITEVYEQLKLPDDMLSGSYANTVVITHSGAEFCFDFITSFFPRSAVAARVYMACPHVLELFESLSRSWEQYRQRGRHS